MTLRLPEPRFPDPRDAPVLRWGVLAPGWIAGHFVGSLKRHTNQRVVAVASRDASRAQAFADEFGVERALSSYDELVNDPGVDVVYVASPHSHHPDQALAAIAAGKHVLVEKPMARNAAEARAIVEAARAAGVLAMEAMWTRYLPHIDVLRQVLEGGTIGQPRWVTGSFATRTVVPDTHRLMDPALAGGVLLDIGIYPLSFASFVATTTGLPAAPTDLQVMGSLAPTGVDAQVAFQVAYPGLQAQLFTSMLTPADDAARVHGEAGWVATGPRFRGPTSVHLTVGDETATWDDNRVLELDGLCFQAAALARYVAAGLTESPLHPLDEVVTVLETADEIRRRLGVVYPGE